AYGRFLEIGKRDIYQNSKLGLQPFLKNLSFFAIDVDRLFHERPTFSESLLHEVIRHFEDGTLKPLPLRVFPISEAASAFRHMAQAKHIGKIVLSLQDQEVLVTPSSEETTTFRSDGTYLITGGLGGFGLWVAQWMVDQGAQHLVLMGRSEPSAAARETLEEMRRAGAQVVFAKGDVIQEQQVASVLAEIGRSMPPLRGIIHAAMVLDDNSLLKLNSNLLKKVMAPKMNGAWHLHTLTLSAPLDFFVLFSSGASMVGFPGQGNYAAANAFLDALAHYRRAQGRPALTINWGRLAEVGYVARHNEVGERLERLGLKKFTPKQAVTILGRLLQQNPVQVGVVRTDWQQWLQLYRASGESPFFSYLTGGKESGGAGEQGKLIRDALLAAEIGERQRLLESYIQEKLGRVLQIDPSRLDLQKPMNSVGLDSLMAVELKTRIETDLGVTVPMVRFIQGPNISQLATQLLALLTESFPPSGLAQTTGADGQQPLTRDPDRGNGEQLLAKLDQLPDEEVDSLLREMLAEGDNK
ncbi:MAG: SDR family NAD(P)-dependent oxidoreductase, partial [Dehalococcoidia bacterium]